MNFHYCHYFLWHTESITYKLIFLKFLCLFYFSFWSYLFTNLMHAKSSVTIYDLKFPWQVLVTLRYRLNLSSGELPSSSKWLEVNSTSCHMSLLLKLVQSSYYFINVFLLFSIFPILMLLPNIRQDLFVCLLVLGSRDILLALPSRFLLDEWAVCKANALLTILTLQPHTFYILYSRRG